MRLEWGAGHGDFYTHSTLNTCSYCKPSTFLYFPTSPSPDLVPLEVILRSRQHGTPALCSVENALVLNHHECLEFQK